MFFSFFGGSFDDRLNFPIEILGLFLLADPRAFAIVEIPDAFDVGVFERFRPAVELF